MFLKGASVNLVDKDNNSALSYALANDFINAYGLLLSFGANDLMRYHADSVETIRGIFLFFILLLLFLLLVMVIMIIVSILSS